jgi:hypothetical protein
LVNPPSWLGDQNVRIQFHMARATVGVPLLLTRWNLIKVTNNFNYFKKPKNLLQ